MATWRAKCWLGSSSGYQELEVESNTSYGAKEQFERIYGAEQVINLRKVGSGSGSSSSSGGGLILVLLILLIYFTVTYWYISLPILAIIVFTKVYGWINDD
jgi:hypothetical protein